MKTSRKIGIGLAGAVGLGVLIVIHFFRQEAYQLYKVLTFFDECSITNNFKNVKNIFTKDVEIVKLSSNYHFKNDDTGYFRYEFLCIKKLLNR